MFRRKKGNKLTASLSSPLVDRTADITESKFPYNWYTHDSACAALTQ